MKFGQDFQAALEREEFPREWIDSALSYKKLKKCIKRVQQELNSFGLDQETLNSLWQHVGRTTQTTPDAQNSERLLHYSINGGAKISFVPKLTIAIDPLDGSPMDAWLSPVTRRHLHQLARSSRSNVTEIDSEDPTTGEDAPQPQEARHENLETVEIPLISDSEFFQTLRLELANLATLQSKEQSSIQSDIQQLGDDLRKLKLSKKRRSKEELDAWRRIFELYTDTQIFLSSHEVDAGARDVAHAQKQLQQFTKQIDLPLFTSSTSLSPSSRPKFLGKDASVALVRFLKINLDLLRLMKFQDINRTALTKIIKKFDKQTALHAQATIPDSLKSSSLVSADLAKATCFTISEELLQIIPQLNDYLCPICFSISYKPVRLSCNHVFCIRCLIVMQRAKQDHCALCRAEVVLAADESNIDKALKHFLEKNFKREVKEKQKANELATGIDRYGVIYGEPAKCSVM